MLENNQNVDQVACCLERRLDVEWWLAVIAKSESQNILIHTLVCRWFPVKALKLLNTHTRTDSAYTFSPQ